MQIDFNDGFNGRFNPKYDVGNFKKSYFKKSLHYENTSEIPVFNILKLHGSLSWKETDREIYLDSVLEQVKEVENNKVSEFYDCFKKLMVVNPTKQKFGDTLLNQRYYDLLRIFSNELEKDNTVLFAMGFSFMDEHIYDLTLRVANSNPTLNIYIFSHGSKPSDTYLKLEADAKNKNIKILIPESGKEYSLETITSDCFDKIILPEKEVGKGLIDTSLPQKDD
ncbi:MAG: SIR2 family protein [Minisyncoccia bacterium]